MPRVDLSVPELYYDNYRTNIPRLWHAVQGTQRPVGDKSWRARYSWWPEHIINRNHRARGLIDNLGIVDGDEVVFVGAGFGWLQEELQLRLPSSKFVSTDISPWVHLVKGQDEEAELRSWMIDDGITDQAEQDLWLSRVFRPGPRAKVPILDESLGDNQSQKRVRTALGLSGSARGRWAVTENVLPWLSDAEALVLSAGMRKVAQTVAHLVTPFASSSKQEIGPLWNWKHLDDVGLTRSDLALQPWYTTASWKALLPSDLFVSVHDYRVV